MSWVWRALSSAGLLVAGLGLFWFAQGVGLVTVEPILCAGSCEPVQAPSPQWQITGALTALAGATAGILAARRARSRRGPQ